MPAKSITVNDAAKHNGCRVEEIYRLLRIGRLTGIKVNGRWQIDPASLARRKHAS